MAKPLCDLAICPRQSSGADCRLTAKAFPLTPAILVFLVAAVAAALVVTVRRRKGDDRARAMRQLLDAADGLEGQLRTARSEIEAIAGSDDNPVKDAMQEMLRQRLWLQQHGHDASIDQLDAVRESIEAAKLRIDRQLVDIERARAIVL